MKDIAERLTQLVDKFADEKWSVFAKRWGIATSTCYSYLKGRPQ